MKNSMGVVLLLLGLQSCAQKNKMPKVANIAEKKWVLQGFYMANNLVKTETNRSFFQIDAGKTQLSGNGGCNNMGGTVRLSDSDIRFSNVIATEMYCTNMPIEQQFFAVLQEANTFSLTDSVLVLWKDKEKLAQFVQAK
jgi:heat shock protein HslJ